MVAHFTMRTYGVNQAFRFVEGIWLHRKSHQIRFFFKDRVYIIRAQREMSNHLILKLWSGVTVCYLQTKTFFIDKENCLFDVFHTFSQSILILVSLFHSFKINLF